MNGRVLVCVASRDRNVALRVMIESLRKTSAGLADVAVYLDDDQHEWYLGFDDVQVIWGPRVGPVAALNRLVTANLAYDVYQAATDDCTFASPGWDRWLIETAKEFEGGLGALAAHLPGSKRMDFPAATNAWVRALGHFAYPGAHHFYWDVLLELLGEAVGIRYATPEQFTIVHDDAPTEDIHWKVTRDARVVISAIARERADMVRKLLQARSACLPV